MDKEKEIPIQINSCIETTSENSSSLYINGRKMSKEEASNRKNGVLGSSFVLISTVLGAGSVSFPLAFKSTGVIGSFVVISICSILAMIATRMTFMVCHYADVPISSFEDLVEHYFGITKTIGKMCRRVVEFIFFFSMSAPSIVFLIVIGDSVSSIANVIFRGNNDFYDNREMVITIFSVLVIFPLCLMRHIKELKITSLVGVLTVLFVIFMIPIVGICGLIPPIQTFFHLPKLPGEGFSSNLFLNVDRFSGIVPVSFMSLPTFAFAFGCQPACVPLARELKNPSMLKYDLITIITFFTVTFAYAMVGFFGYLMFGNLTGDDILRNFPNSFIPALIGRLCMAVHCTFAFPITSYLQRSSLNSVLFGKQDTKTIYHLVVTLIVFFGNLLMALLIPNITVIFGFTVSVGLQIISFLLPAVMVMLLIRRRYSEKRIGVRMVLHSLPLIVILCSVFLMIIGPLTSFLQMRAQGRH